jgi:transcriptional regulator with XRE-family HTH domain
MGAPRRQPLGAVLWLRDITQSRFAEQLDVPRPRVSQWCEGRRRPSPKMQERIAAELRMRVDELFDADMLGRS